MLIGLINNAAAALILPNENSDEARLEVLDLDLTDEELCGKVLRWDDELAAWRPDALRIGVEELASGE